MKPDETWLGMLRPVADRNSSTDAIGTILIELRRQAGSDGSPSAVDLDGKQTDVLMHGGTVVTSLEPNQAHGDLFMPCPMVQTAL